MGIYDLNDDMVFSAKYNPGNLITFRIWALPAAAEKIN